MSLRNIASVAVLLAFQAMVQAQVAGGYATTMHSTGVKGVPFSADTVSEVNQVLADGNRIQRETHGRQFRDSEGRTRTETEVAVPNGEVFQHVMIMDPVQGTAINLDPRNKIATVHHMGRDSGPTTHPAPNATPNLTAKLQALPTAKTEDLGTMQIEGLTAIGIRHTRTIEAGKIGNQQPITTVMEIWTSPVLKTVLLTQTDDPQSGRRTMKLVNIQTTEPDPSLFQAPSDYQIRDDAQQNR